MLELIAVAGAIYYMFIRKHDQTSVIAAQRAEAGQKEQRFEERVIQHPGVIVDDRDYALERGNRIRMQEGLQILSRRRAIE